MKLDGKIYAISGNSIETGEESYTTEIKDFEYNVSNLTAPTLNISCYAAISNNESNYVIGYFPSSYSCEFVTQTYDARTNL